MKTVAHFVRKSSQLKASFIYNQINTHQTYKPAIVYKKKVYKKFDGGFVDNIISVIPELYIENPIRNELPQAISFLKGLSKKETMSVLSFLDEYNVDVLHFHYGTDACIYRQIIKCSRCPSVVSFYGYDCSSFPKKMMGLGSLYLQQFLFKHVSKVLAMSEDMKHDLIMAGCPLEKIIIHYYGTDVHKFRFTGRNFLLKKKPTLFMLASLVPQKGHIFLLRSIKRLIEGGIINFELRLAGTGELEQELKQYVRNNKLDEYVIFLGPVIYGSNIMINELKNADIFVHPSVIAPNGDKEGIPGTIIEAMAAGLPVVSTYHAGIPSVIKNYKTGLLVKEWDYDQLAEAITTLIKDAGLRKEIGCNAQSYALQELDLIMKEKELEEIYDSIIH